MIGTSVTPGCNTGWDLDRLDGLRSYLDPARAAERVSRHVPALRDGRLCLEELLPERVEARAAVSIEGRAVLRDARTGQRGARWIRMWHGASDDVPTADESDLEGQDSTGVRIAISPRDTALPELGATLEAPERLAEIVEGGRVRTASGSLVGHRFGRRAAVRLDWTTPRGTARTVLAKLFAGRGDRRLVRIAREVARCGPQGIDPPPVLAHESARRIVVLGWAPGETAHDTLERVSGHAIGLAVRTLQRADSPDLPTHRRCDELATVRRFVGWVTELRPRVGWTLAELLGRLAAYRWPDSPCVLAHRDLHDKQMIHTGNRVRLIDWDLAAVAPAGLDPGNFLAHLELRELQQRISALRASELRREFLAGYGKRDPSVPTWERIARLRLAAVYALRPRWTGVADALLARLRAELAA